MINLSLTQKIFIIILGLFLLFAGVGHLTWQKTEFLAQVPSWVPLDTGLGVLLSGIVEIILGISLAFLEIYLNTDTGRAIRLVF